MDKGIPHKDDLHIHGPGMGPDPHGTYEKGVLAGYDEEGQLTVVSPKKGRGWHDYDEVPGADGWANDIFRDYVEEELDLVVSAYIDLGGDGRDSAIPPSEFAIKVRKKLEPFSEPQQYLARHAGSLEVVGEEFGKAVDPRIDRSPEHPWCV